MIHEDAVVYHLKEVLQYKHKVAIFHNSEPEMVLYLGTHFAIKKLAVCYNKQQQQQEEHQKMIIYFKQRQIISYFHIWLKWLH